MNKQIFSIYLHNKIADYIHLTRRSTEAVTSDEMALYIMRLIQDYLNSEREKQSENKNK